MKKITLLLILILILPALTGIDRRTEGSSSPSFPDSVLALFPLWEENIVDTYSTGFQHIANYRGITPDMVTGYIASQQDKGFQLLSHEKNPYEMALYRTDCFITISDNSASYGECRVCITCARESAYTLTGEDEQAFQQTFSELCCAVDISPDGLYDSSGMRLYSCLFKKINPTTGYGLPNPFVEQFFLFGNGMAYRMDSYSLAWADLDRDGQIEIVSLFYGPTSGVFTERIEIYSVKDCIPYIRAAGIFNMEYGKTGLIRKDGSVYYRYARQNYFVSNTTKRQFDEPSLLPITFANGRVMLDGMESLGIAYWGAPNGQYISSSYRNSEKLDITIYAWQENGEWLCVLTEAANDIESPDDLNYYAPMSLNAAAYVLREWNHPLLFPKKENIYITARPVKNKEDIRKASEEELEFLCRELCIE